MDPLQNSQCLQNLPPRSPAPLPTPLLQDDFVIVFFTKYNIRKLSLLSKTDIRKTTWINPCKRKQTFPVKIIKSLRFSSQEAT